MKVHIRRGKGSKDRLVTLPQLTLETLRRYWNSHRHPTWIFPRRRRHGWQCEWVGRGLQALQYLPRYLYRGVISNHNVIEDDGAKVTFRYRDSQTQTIQTRTLPGEDFMALLLQHVLPKGLHRARDYGFLHGNAKRILKIVQWVLRVPLPVKDEKRNAQFRCPHCHGRMLVIRLTPPHPLSG